MSLLDTVKQHPVIVGGIAIFAVIVIIVVASSGGSTAAASVVPTSDGSTGDATQLQLAQMAQQSDANNTSASLQALQIQGANQTALATISAQSTDNANYLAYKSNSENTQAQLTSVTLQSTLAAQIAAQQSSDQHDEVLAGFANQQTLANIQANQNIQTQAMLTGVLTQQNATQQQQNSYNYALQSQSMYDQTAVQLTQSQYNYSLQSQMTNNQANETYWSLHPG